MAKQNKGRKFFAASATAALVASAIVPVASAAQLNDFNKISGYAKEAVQSLVDAGVIQGDANGNFNPLKTISRAEAATIFTNALELEAEGAVDFKDVKADAWYYDAIAATVENGIFEGVSATEFAPNKQLTRSEAAKILVDAFGLEGEGDLSEFADASTVKPWAKSYLEIAVANGVIKGSEANGKTNLNPNAPITRQDFAVVFSRTVENVDATPKVDKIEVVDAKTLNVTLSDGTKETVTLETALEPNKETEVTFKIKDVEYKAKVTYVVTTATAVKSVSATNLKQVVVEFDGKVDPSTAAEEGNYALTGTNDPVVDTAVVAEDGRSVTLTLKHQFENQAEYKLSLNNIKAGDKVLNEKDLKFKPLDNTVPTVAKVEALGNKTIRVHFSEPVKAAQTSQFQIDGKVVVGSIQTNLNTVIIKLSSALTDGEHTLTAEGTEDYNNFKTVKADTKFNVVEDKTAPTVSVVSASFEKVVLKFSEPVEQVFASNIYWMQGGTKKQATSVKQLADDKFELTFNNDNKLVYTTDLYVTNVKDYSGNVIDKDTKVQVTPVIDQTRPEVISSTFVKDSNNKQITIKFTKSLDTKTAEKAANYVIKDKDGKVQPISSKVDTSKNKEVTITLLGNLKDNTDYTLSVNGVSDDTTLKNVMLPYTTTLSVKDVTAPKLLGVTLLNPRQLYVSFDEAMATSGDGSIVDTDKYSFTMPSGWAKPTIASFNVTQDAKGVILNFTKDLPGAGSDFKVKVQLVKDLAGNHLDGLFKELEVDTQKDTKVDTVKATAKNKVEVKFTNPIQSLVQGDFKVEGSEIAHSEISNDGKTVTFTLKTDLPEDALNADTKAKLKLTVTSGSTVDVLGKKIQSEIKDIDDKIQATVKEIVKVDGEADQIKITFNEAVTPETGANTDFIVLDNLDDQKEVDVKNVTQDSDKKSIILHLEKAVVSATVSAKDVRFVKDGGKNAIADIEKTTVELGKVNTAPVDAVVKQIADLTNTSTIADVDAARTAYNALTAAQQKLVPTASVNALDKKEQDFVNAEAGKITAANLAGALVDGENVLAKANTLVTANANFVVTLVKSDNAAIAADGAVTQAVAETKGNVEFKVTKNGKEKTVIIELTVAAK
ncbi:S-layer homology domain-containing protein [Lysinibacillus fusiformis]|uniref:S-layer homology domain-containing protein n=1 Tax=Lysinibacillus fusiformis TaxID=28031 RepID=UPI0021BFE4D5|nr:S-layer homology domain-containing protein [Lysinibacillus fusiformis]UXJ69482.1 S-layer homology domain-containing protein [Lysinibacillus fusiformis]